MTEEKTRMLFEFSTTELPPEAIASSIEVYLPKEEKPVERKAGLRWGVGVPTVTLGSERKNGSADNQH